MCRSGRRVSGAVRRYPPSETLGSSFNKLYRLRSPSMARKSEPKSGTERLPWVSTACSSGPTHPGARIYSDVPVCLRQILLAYARHSIRFLAQKAYCKLQPDSWHGISNPVVRACPLPESRISSTPQSSKNC